jgi:hypothetical protein
VNLLKRTSVVFALALVPFVGCGSDDDKKPASKCGNGTIDDGEDCDGTNLDSETCATVGMGTATSGTLACTSTCTFDLSGCMPAASGGSPGSGGAGSGGTPGSGGLGGVGAMGGMMSEAGAEAGEGGPGEGGPGSGGAPAEAGADGSTDASSD